MKYAMVDDYNPDKERYDGPGFADLKKLTANEREFLLSHNYLPEDIDNTNPIILREELEEIIKSEHAGKIAKKPDGGPGQGRE